MDLNLSDRTVLVTGSSKGIGKGIAQMFAEEGAAVAICARGSEALKEAENELKSNGGRVVAVQADMAKEGDVVRVYEKTMSEFGKIDVLVNNAGVGYINRNFDLSEEEWKSSLDINLMSMIRMTRAVVPQMKERKWGRIINISSINGHTMWAGMVDYQVAKSAMIAYSKTMALELAPDNILVNTICPGPVVTPLWDRLADEMVGVMGASREEVYNNFGSQVPLGRHGEVKEIAGLAAFLASDYASYMTGAAIDIDGGITKTT